MNKKTTNGINSDVNQKSKVKKNFLVMIVVITIITVGILITTIIFTSNNRENSQESETIHITKGEDEIKETEVEVTHQKNEEKTEDVNGETAFIAAVNNLNLSGVQLLIWDPVNEEIVVLEDEGRYLFNENKEFYIYSDLGFSNPQIKVTFAKGLEEGEFCRQLLLGDFEKENIEIGIAGIIKKVTLEYGYEKENLNDDLVNDLVLDVSGMTYEEFKMTDEFSNILDKELDPFGIIWNSELETARFFRDGDIVNFADSEIVIINNDTGWRYVSHIANQTVDVHSYNEFTCFDIVVEIPETLEELNLIIEFENRFIKGTTFEMTITFVQTE